MNEGRPGGRSRPYVDVAIARWQNLTGQAAVLDGTDKTFADLTATRR